MSSVIDGLWNELTRMRVKRTPGHTRKRGAKSIMEASRTLQNPKRLLDREIHRAVPLSREIPTQVVAEKAMREAWDRKIPLLINVNEFVLFGSVRGIPDPDKGVEPLSAAETAFLDAIVKRHARKQRCECEYQSGLMWVVVPREFLDAN